MSPLAGLLVQLGSSTVTVWCAANMMHAAYVHRREYLPLQPLIREAITQNDTAALWLLHIQQMHIVRRCFDPFWFFRRSTRLRVHE
jgi:hypothetical protein